MAKCYEKMNNDTKVIEYYESALNLNPKFIIAYYDYVKYLFAKKDYVEAQRKLRKALKIDNENIVLLNLMFFASYILVKDNLCEYNVKETLAIANKIEKINPDLFEYPEQKAELERILQEDPERD